MAFALQVDLVEDSRAAKEVMAGVDTLLKTKVEEQSAQFIEPDVGVGPAAQNLRQELPVTSHPLIVTNTEALGLPLNSRQRSVFAGGEG